MTLLQQLRLSYANHHCGPLRREATRMQTFVAAVLSGFRHYFNFRGRATKAEFWYFLLFWFLAYVVVVLIDQAALAPVIDLREVPGSDLVPYAYMDPQIGLLTLLYRPLTAIPTLSVTVRRLHDAGKSGWYSVLWILPVPVLGWFWLVPMLLKPSQIETEVAMQSDGK